MDAPDKELRVLEDKDTDAVRFPVRVVPRARREAIEGVDAQGILRIRVTAPPEGGRANAAVRELIARALGIPRSRVRIASGERSRDKWIAVSGLRSNQLPWVRPDRE